MIGRSRRISLAICRGWKLGAQLTVVKERNRNSSFASAEMPSLRMPEFMTSSDSAIITVPGLYGSDSTHWQSRWEKKFGYVRAELGRWNDPFPNEWEGALSSILKGATKPVVLVGHSLGSMLIVRYLSKHTSHVVGAFLVAPTDTESSSIPEEAKRFSPIPMTRLPVPSVVVATGSDPYLSIHRSLEFATTWGASLRILEQGGHLGRDAGLGEWVEGHQLLQTFIQNLPTTRSEELRQ